MYFTLKEIYDELNCDRVVVAKIHPLSLDNLTQEVFSIMFEHKKQDLKSLIPTMKNLPIYILYKEFEDLYAKDKIVVANKTYIKEYKDPRCVQHLDNIEMEVIINQLLYYNKYVWGVLSFQFNYKPDFIYQDTIKPEFIEYIKQFKLHIANLEFLSKDIKITNE